MAEAATGLSVLIVDDDAASARLMTEVLRARRFAPVRHVGTGREALEVRAERLAAIGEMTVTLHHGINNPLMSASTEVELLLGRRHARAAPATNAGVHPGFAAPDQRYRAPDR